jgi:hypothetical protein
VGVLGTIRQTVRNKWFALFIKKEDHQVVPCPVRKQGHKCAQYVGSAASGLEFYNIELPEKEDRLYFDFANCGKVYIETSEITKDELQLELATCFNPNWSW